MNTQTLVITHPVEARIAKGQGKGVGVEGMIGLVILFAVVVVISGIGKLFSEW